jgi:type IV pilus assembly protein PilM
MSNLPKIGIDIGAASIKVVELAPQGKRGWKLLSMASMPTPPGGIAGNQANIAPMAATIARLIKEAGIRSHTVVASIPEEFVSSHILQMPPMPDSEIEQALEWQVEQYIPIPQDQAIWSHKIIKKGTDDMEVLLVAVSKVLVEAYRNTFEQAGLNVEALETELMATARAELRPDSPLVVVVDIGARSTDVGVARAQELIFSRTIPTAGEAFTRAIETILGLDVVQAEQYKNTYGFSQSQLDGKLLAAMQPVLTSISGEIKKTIDFYISKHAGEGIRSVVLSGGVASLPDVISAFSSQLGMEVVVGNPFERVILDPAQQKALVGQGSFYSVAVGLAQRE